MSLWKRIRLALRDIPLALQAASALGAVVVVVLPALGYLTHRHRLVLMDLPTGFLTYGPEELALTGASVIWALPWRVLYAIADPTTPLFLPTLMLALLAVALVWGQRFVAEFFVAKIGLGAVLVLFFVSLSYAYSLPYPTEGSLTSSLRGSGALSRARLEASSWLSNSSDINRRNREAMAGFVGWLLLTAALAFRWLGPPPLQAATTKLGVAIAVLLVAFLFGQLPRAHAYAEWGWVYPKVVAIDAACGNHTPVDPGAAWLVSLGAREEYLLREGDQGPELQPLNHPDGGRCSTLGRPGVVLSTGGSGPAATPEEDR